MRSCMGWQWYATHLKQLKKITNDNNTQRDHNCKQVRNKRLWVCDDPQFWGKPTGQTGRYRPIPDAGVVFMGEGAVAKFGTHGIPVVSPTCPRFHQEHTPTDEGKALLGVNLHIVEIAGKVNDETSCLCKTRLLPNIVYRCTSQCS